MVSRTKKIAAAATILAIGLLLAWPLRRTAPSGELLTASTSRVIRPAHPLLELGQVSQSDSAPASMASLTIGGAVEPRLTEAASPQSAAPVLSGKEPSLDSHGAGTTADEPAVEPEVRVHVVHNGDTLERLAKRYLGSESRALEIFDLNRDLLSNPHLLPIGAELRLPAGRESTD